VKRAGARRLLHLVRVHLADELEATVWKLTVPLLVIRGVDDRLSTARWGRELVMLRPGGEYVELPGAHTFPWLDPQAWSEPVRRFTTRVS
jgi:pimeloyl-ACP methyl ester carboxylesterase